MERLYIFDPTNFDGSVMNTGSVHEDSLVYVDYMKKPTTFEEYKKEKGNENLIALSWEEFSQKFYEPYLKGLQRDWSEISKDEYWDLLECLPPMRWTQGVISFFFISEATTASLHQCVIKDCRGDEIKFYSALRSIFLKEEEVLQNFTNQIIC